MTDYLEKTCERLEREGKGMIGEGGGSRLGLLARLEEARGGLGCARTGVICCCGGSCRLAMAGVICSCGGSCRLAMAGVICSCGGELQARLGELKAAALCSAVVAAPMAKKMKRKGDLVLGYEKGIETSSGG